VRRKPSFAPPPDEEGGGAKRKPNNLPFLSLGALFKGRDGFLTDLRQRLAKPDGKAAAIVARQALYGLGGVGTSRPAIEYAWRYADDYSALLFVRAPSPSDLDGNPASPKVESSGGLRANLAALTGVLRIETEEKAVDRQVELVLRWLEEHHGWLLILDNVDTPESAQEAEALLARLRGGHVLITSRRADWSPSVEPLELHTLAEKDAVAFLAERTQTKRKKAPRDEADAAAIARAWWPGAGARASRGLHRQAAALVRGVSRALGGQPVRGALLVRSTGDAVSGERGEDLADDL
jgi:hypothetical protein